MRSYLSEADPGTRILRRCDELAAISRPGAGVTRLYLTEEHKRAIELVSGWMREAGMDVHVDEAANVVGRYAPAQQGSPSLFLGSHIDSVIDAGKYDGPLGVICAIDCVSVLNQAKRRLPFGVEIVAFGDEEGTRFGTTLIGSRAITGALIPNELSIEDKNGVSIAAALRDFGIDPERIGAAARKAEDMLAYVELHIEQGPVLEHRDLPVGIVSSISAQIRKRVTLTSEPNHAGTVPMRLRHDPFLAAAEIALAAEQIAAGIPDAVATVGQVDVKPGAMNVIPGHVTISLDMRARTDEILKDMVARIDGEVARIAAARGVGMKIQTVLETRAAPCSPELIDRLAAAVRSAGVEPLHLPSGAGHDGMAIAALAPIAMIFVRCEKGISHSPLEAVEARDVTVAVQVLQRFINDMAAGR
ncbi:MAG: allantoate amidohydrolase [Pseudomonadota bacterium]